MRPLLPPILLAALSAPGIAGASVPDLFGYGARATGLAGAVVSTARGHEGIYYNPGALAFERRPSFSIGYQRADFALELNGQPAEVRAAPATLIGFDIPMPLGGFMARRLTLAAGFVIPTTSILVADVPRPGQRRFVIVESRAQTVSLQSALGLRLTDWLSVGAGFLALSELDGAIDVAPNAEGRIGSLARDQLVADFAPIAGLLLRLPWLPGQLRAGAVYRGESAAEFRLPITVELGDRFPIPIPVLDIAGTAQYDPEQAGLEISGVPWSTLRVAAGLTWKRWSRFPNPIVYTAVPSDFPEQPPPNFQDIVERRLGLELPLELGALGVEPRLGYEYTPTPVPEQRGLHNYLDSDRHLFAAGVGLRWQDLHLDLGLQLHRVVDRLQEKDAAELAEQGEAFPPEQNEGWPNVYAGGWIFNWGVELGVDL